MSENNETENEIPEDLTDVAADESNIDEVANDDATGNQSSADENRIENLTTENAELKDQLLRAMAETQNLRRRSDKERSDAANYAVTKFARDMLAVSDNLNRALGSLPKDFKLPDELKNLIEGVKMTDRDLLSTFERYGIKKIEPVGEKFDANFHQAMFEVPNTGEENGTIVQVMQCGFVIKDRLLRPAMVGVAKGGEKPPQKVDVAV